MESDSVRGEFDFFDTKFLSFYVFTGFAEKSQTKREMISSIPNFLRLKTFSIIQSKKKNILYFFLLLHFFNISEGGFA